MTALEIVKEVAAKAGHSLTDDEADYLLWNETGFPCFWNPADGATPEECVRTQIGRVYGVTS